MLHILLLVVQALPAYVPYNDQVVAIDYDSVTGLAVGTQKKYVSKVVEAARWANLTSVNQPKGKHLITGWRAGGRTPGIYLTHTTSGQNWKTYVPDIADITVVTAANLDSLLAMYTGISQSPGMQTKDLFDFVVPQAVKALSETQNPTAQQIIAALPVLNSTFRALQKTSRVLQEVVPWQRHSKERDALREKHDRQSEALASEYQKQRELLQRKLSDLPRQHQEEQKQFKPLGDKLKELDQKRIEERQKTVREEKRGEEQETTAKIKAIEEKYTQLKSTLELEYPKDFLALTARQEQEKQRLKQDLEDLPRRFGSSFSFSFGDDNENENTEFGRLRETQEKEWKDLLEKYAAEERQHGAQTDKMRDAEGRLEQKIRVVLTPEVAAALQVSNPAAVKGFLELFLEYGAHYGHDQYDIISTLLGKISNVTSLDLSQANSHLVQRLFQNPAFTSLISSAATLSTISEVHFFSVLLETCMDLSQPNQGYQDREFDDFFGKHRELFEIEIYRIVFRNVVGKIQKEQGRFATNCSNFRAIIDSEDGFTREAIDAFSKKSENVEFNETFEKEMQQQRESVSGIEKEKQQAAEQFSKVSRPNQQIWQQLLQLLNTAKAREEAFLAQQRANKQLSAKAFERVVIEMKRRFDTVGSSEEEQRRKIDLVNAAKSMWAPEYSASEAEERQAQIREISPEAAHMLEEMTR